MKFHRMINHLIKGKKMSSESFIKGDYFLALFNK